MRRGENARTDVTAPTAEPGVGGGVLTSGRWPASSARSETTPWRSASTSWLWIVSKLIWQACTKQPFEVAVAIEGAAISRTGPRRVEVPALDDVQLVGPLQSSKTGALIEFSAMAMESRVDLRLVPIINVASARWLCVAAGRSKISASAKS